MLGWPKLRRVDAPELQSFAAGVEKDKDAVKAGLTWPVNNGMVEGHVTKLKLIKRQGYSAVSAFLLRENGQKPEWQAKTRRRKVR